jgi:hypothetical protein
MSLKRIDYSKKVNYRFFSIDFLLHNFIIIFKNLFKWVGAFLIAKENKQCTEEKFMEAVEAALHAVEAALHGVEAVEVEAP